MGQRSGITLPEAGGTAEDQGSALHSRRAVRAPIGAQDCSKPETGCLPDIKVECSVTPNAGRSIEAANADRRRGGRHVRSRAMGESAEHELPRRERAEMPFHSSLDRVERNHHRGGDLWTG